MPRTIMIVDDSASTRQLAGIVLKEDGYELIEACDGVDALAKLNGRKVHLIISDVNMPNMDGITFVKTVKTMPVYESTPIIMLTGFLKNAHEQACGVEIKAWMVKPFDKNQLLEMVARFALP